MFPCRIASLAGLTMLLSYPAAAEPTYTRDVARIIQAKCQQCHHPNDVAPFALTSYDDAVTYADDIKQALTKRTMPPWKPVPGYGEFKDSYGITGYERQTFLDWIDSGMSKGDPADAPDPLPLNDSPWQLGSPDLVLQMPEYTPPRSADTYRCFSMPTGVDDRKYINAAEALPGSRQEVHHILLFLDENGDSAKLDGQDGDPGYTCFGGPGIELNGVSALKTAVGGILGAWVPGARIRRLDEGIGVLLPGKSRVIVQVHYHPSGRITPDRTQVGFYYAPTESIQHRMLTIPIVNTTFKIPPGASDREVTASFTVPFFATGKAIVVAPHMHLLGRKINLEIAERDGTVLPVIRIDDWDFNWQGFYTLQEPIQLKAGSVIRLSATYDNSEGNPRNPNNPLKVVGWGEGTNDEMCLAFLGVILDNESLAGLFGATR